MRNLNFTSDSPQSIKLGDSSDTISLRVTELDQPVDLSRSSSITVKIGNTAGFITEINVDVSSLIHPTDGRIDVVIDSKISSELPAGQYLLEVWIDYINGNVAIFPDTSYPSVIGFSIKKNIMSATSTVITTLTLADFEAKFDDLQKDLQDKVTSGYFKGDKGDKGDKGVKGDTGPQGDTGPTGIQGPKGDTGAAGAQGIQGPVGKGFSIAKIYPSVAEMTAAKGAGLTTGDFVIIASTVSSPDNATLYTWNGTTYVEIADLSGAQGIQGPQGIQGVKGDMGATGPTGPQGIQGPAGPKGDKGDKGDDAVINIISQADYDALADKSGVYFIEG